MFLKGLFFRSIVQIFKIKKNNDRDKNRGNLSL